MCKSSLAVGDNPSTGVWILALSCFFLWFLLKLMQRIEGIKYEEAHHGMLKVPRLFPLSQCPLARDKKNKEKFTAFSFRTVNMIVRRPNRQKHNASAQGQSGRASNPTHAHAAEPSQSNVPTSLKWPSESISRPRRDIPLTA